MAKGHVPTSQCMFAPRGSSWRSGLHLASNRNGAGPPVHRAHVCGAKQP